MVPPNPEDTPEIIEPQNRFAAASQIFSRLHRYQITLRKHWWVLVLSLVVAFAPACYFAINAPVKFQSKGRMWMSGKLNIPEGKVYSEELSTFIGAQAELMRLSTVQERALAKIIATHPDWMYTNDDAAYKIDVKEYPKSAVYELSGQGPIKEATQAYVDAVMEEYLKFRKDARDQSSDSTLASITQQITQLKEELHQKQEALIGFQSSNNVVFLQEQGNSAANYLASVNKQLADLRMERQLLDLMTPSQLAEMALKPRNSDASPGELSAKEFYVTMAGPQNEYQKAFQQIQLLKAKRDELGQFLRPMHPKMIKYEEDIAQQGQLMDIFKVQSLSQLSSRRDSVVLQIKNLEDAFKEWDGKALSASRKMAEYDSMRQETQRTQSLYERLLSVLQTVDVNKNVDVEVVRIMQKATPAVAINKKYKILALGLFAGIFFGFGILFVIEMFDDKFASISELRMHLSELVVGQIPEIPLAQGHKNLELIQNNDERHVFIEAFRNMRSSLLYMFDQKSRPKTILVTSSVPSEGKTTIAANLAVSLAQSGSKVLLLDFDLRRPGIHKIINISQTPGTAEVLEQKTHAAQVMVKAHHDNLTIIPAGDADGNPGELFLSPSTDVYLKDLYPQYDFIIIDSAPILAADDTASLAPKVDGVLFVVRGSYTSARMAHEALEHLHQRHVNVIGLIFNRGVATASEYYYYYRYSDYYYHKPKRRGTQALATAKKTTGNGGNGDSGKLPSDDRI